MIDKIEEVMDKYVRPELSKHYGNVKVISFEEGVLKIALTGQCSGCPSASFTVEDIVEKEIKEHVPEVEEVVLINQVSDDLLDFARRILNKEEDK